MRDATQLMSNMYCAPADEVGGGRVPETDSGDVPDFVFDFIAHGVPQIAAEALGRRIARTCRSLRDGLITEADAEERIDRDAGAVFMALKAQRDAA